jgi:hypothetical protein
MVKVQQTNPLPIAKSNWPATTEVQYKQVAPGILLMSMFLDVSTLLATPNGISLTEIVRCN